MPEPEPPNTQLSDRAIEIFGSDDTGLSEEPLPGEHRVDLIAEGPYRVGDTMANGVKIESSREGHIEFLYPSGIRVTSEVGRLTPRYIRPDGAEAQPGEVLLLGTEEDDGPEVWVISEEEQRALSKELSEE